MAWCPKCKNEYIEGITRCSDCNEDLIDELPEEREIEYIDVTNIIDIIPDAEDMIEYLHKAHIENAEYVYNEDEDATAICVDKKDYENARLLLNVYIQNEVSTALNNKEINENKVTDTAENSEVSADADNGVDSESSEDSIDNISSDTESDVSENENTTPTKDNVSAVSVLENETIDTAVFSDSEAIDVSDEDAQNILPLISPKKSTYTNLSDKLEDVKSSAYTLLLVGILGAIAMVMEVAGIYDIPIAESTKWLFYTVMGGIFIAFIISGFTMLMHTKELKIEAEQQEATKNEILTWFNENHTKESIDSEIDTDIQEELLYFNRAEQIKYVIMHQFEDVDEPLVEALIENIYTDLFE